MQTRPGSGVMVRDLKTLNQGPGSWDLMLDLTFGAGNYLRSMCGGWRASFILNNVQCSVDCSIPNCDNKSSVSDNGY